MSQYEAGRETDAAVAERVMEWPWRSDDGKIYGAIPRYSTDIAAAWEVVEKLSPKWAIMLDNNDMPGPDWWCLMAHGTTVVEATAPTAPLAICRAALAALSPQGEP